MQTSGTHHGYLLPRKIDLGLPGPVASTAKPGLGVELCHPLSVIDLACLHAAGPLSSLEWMFAQWHLMYLTPLHKTSLGRILHPLVGLLAIFGTQNLDV